MLPHAPAASYEQKSVPTSSLPPYVVVELFLLHCIELPSGDGAERRAAVSQPLARRGSATWERIASARPTARRKNGAPRSCIWSSLGD